jgi:hypothetical protein
MLTGFVDDLGLVAILLGLGAAVLVGLWFRGREKKYLYAAGVFAALGLVAGLVWFFAETDQRKIRRKLEEMAAGIPGDLNRVFRHISTEFRYGSQDKNGLRSAAENAIRQRNVTEVRVWDIKLDSVDRDKREGRVNFRFKISGKWSEALSMFFCRATFRLDEDGEWRMQNFTVYNPVNINDPIQVPGL